MGVSGCVAVLRFAGLLQSLELAAFDQVFQIRPLEPVDSRIVIISIDDDDINQVRAWPISDALMAKLLEKVRSYEPRAIGLDIYRELPVEPGQEDLQRVFRTTPNLVGIEKIPDTDTTGVQPPVTLNENNQVGFNNVVVDADGTVRRGLLFWTVDGNARMSFALKLALMYLKPEGIVPQAAAVNSDYLQLGQGVFHPFQPNDGGYVRADSGGYQILGNFRRFNVEMQKISMTDVLAGNVPDDLMRDRIVLIGSTAVSLKDFFYTPLSAELVGSARPTSGVELHANIISQILSTALDGRSLLRVWPSALEWGWILVWAWIGASLSWKIRSPERSAIGILSAGGGLALVYYLAFLGGWWIPLVPALLAMVGSAVMVTGYIAHLEEELKKSKEFLNSVINTIPDPIFVKDKRHRWIVLNEAYCRLIGHPLETLIEKSDYDFLPAHQATNFWQQDEQIFNTGLEQENEEELTNANGHTYLIATKRSLHRDAAGNKFLVGVIRDITQRKRVEEELKRTAAELVRSNAELRQTEDRLRRMAYHDPLTGLPNRKLFEERLIQALEWAQGHNQILALLFLDLDGFKSINDSYGHQMGDLLLKAVAQRLTGSLRGSDTVARLGGDEFVVLLPVIPGVADVKRVAEKILATLSQSFLLDGKTIPVTTSIGISLCPLNGNTLSSLIEKADMAMYEAKELGKNRYAFAQGAEPEPPLSCSEELTQSTSKDYSSRSVAELDS